MSTTEQRRRSDRTIVDDYRVCRAEMPRGDIRPSVKEGTMLRSAKELRGYAIGASDGDIGQVDDLYFDDEAWVMRYLAVDTGTWLSGRRVLISPISLGQPDWMAQRLPVALTRERVRNSPDIDTQKPVSRQHEADYFGYYGYPYYWGGMGMWGMGAYPGYLMTASAVQADDDRAVGGSEGIAGGRRFPFAQLQSRDRPSHRGDRW